MTREQEAYHNGHLDEANRHRALRKNELRIAELEAERDGWRKLCEFVDAHYSGSLDHRPVYVKLIRDALEGN